MNTDMNTFKRRLWAVRFYWLGVVMTLASIALVLAGNTKLIYPFEHTSFPLAWKLAAIAVVAFLVGEICSPPHRRTLDKESRLAMERRRAYEIY